MPASRMPPIAAAIASSTGALHSPGAVGTVLHRAFSLGDLGRHANNDARAHPHGAVVRLLDEVREHLLGDLEVGDDAVLHRLDGHDVAGRPAQHLLGFLPDGLDLPGDLIDGDDGRFVDDDALAPRVDTRIGGAEIDSESWKTRKEERGSLGGTPETTGWASRH
jgi:hypothetical protein